MKDRITKFYRQELFDHYNNKTNPFSFVTTKIDITKAYNYSRVHKNLYALLGYTFTKAMNRIENFKYGYEDGIIYKYDKINPNFTQKLNDDNVSFIDFDYDESYEIFLNNYLNTKKELDEKQCAINNANPECGYVWMSCLPWFKFTGVVPPFDTKVTIPQLIWDKYEIVDGHAYINLMIMAHHGFIDGYHIGLLVQYINEELDSIKED